MSKVYKHRPAPPQYNQAWTGAEFAAIERSQSSGAWNPTIIGATTAGVQTYAHQSGIWTFADGLVVAQGYVQVSAFGGTIAGNVMIGGLPFVANNASNISYGAAAIGYYTHLTLSTGNTQVGAVVIPGTNTLRLYQNGSGVNASPIAPTQFASSAELIFTVSYSI